MQSFRKFIDDNWRTPEAMARALGLTVAQARHWKTRDTIPSEYWLQVIKGARRAGAKEGEDVLLRQFARLAAKRLTAAATTADKNSKELSPTP